MIGIILFFDLTLEGLHCSEILVLTLGGLHQSEILVLTLGGLHQSEILVLTLGGLHQSEILVLTLGGLHQSEILVIPLGELRVKQAVQRGNLGTKLTFAVGPRKTTEHLDRDGRSQELPDAN
jgi:hypothetical protein